MASLRVWYLTFSWGTSLLFPVFLLLFSLFLLFLIFPFSSVTQSCLTLCDPMDCSAPGFPVHHQDPELAQTDVQVSDAKAIRTELLAIHQLPFRLPYLHGLPRRFQLVGFCSGRPVYSPVCLSNLGSGSLLLSLLRPHCHRSLALCDLPSLAVTSLLLHI